MLLQIPIFKTKLLEFANSRIMSSIANQNDRFFLGLGIGAKLRNVEYLLNEAGVLTSNGEVDLTALDEILRCGFAATIDGKLRFTHSMLHDKLVFSIDDWNNFKSFVLPLADTPPTPQIQPQTVQIQQPIQQIQVQQPIQQVPIQQTYQQTQPINPI